MMFFSWAGIIFLCTYAITGITTDTAHFFLPEKISRRLTIPGQKTGKSTLKKRTIVIDGAALGLNNATSSTAISATRNGSQWWSGFETAYTNEEVLQALLDRASSHISLNIDTQKALKLFREGRHESLYDSLRDKIIRGYDSTSQKEAQQSFSDLYACLGVLLMENMQFTDAEEIFGAALKVDKNNNIARLLLGENYIEEEQFERAEDAVRPLASSLYYPVRLNALMSKIDQHNNQISSAIRHWERVLERINPGVSERLRLRFLESELNVQQNFHTYSTSHYVIRYDPIFEDSRERVLSPILAIVDEARLRLNRRFGVNPSGKTILHIYTQDAFDSLLNGSFRNLEAFFDAEDGKLRIAIKGDATSDVRLLKPAIFHEYVHFLLHEMTCGRLRLRWLHEGLATYYEREETRIDRFTDIATAPTPEPIDTKHLMTDKVTRMDYYRSRKVVEFLIKRYSEKRMMDFLNHIGKGKSFHNALTETFGMSYEQLARKVAEEVR